jgi:hypothetical protein
VTKSENDHIVALMTTSVGSPSVVVAGFANGADYEFQSNWDDSLVHPDAVFPNIHLGHNYDALGYAALRLLEFEDRDHDGYYVPAIDGSPLSNISFTDNAKYTKFVRTETHKFGGTQVRFNASLHPGIVSFEYEMSSVSIPDVLSAETVLASILIEEYPFKKNTTKLAIEMLVAGTHAKVDGSMDNKLGVRDVGSFEWRQADITAPSHASTAPVGAFSLLEAGPTALDESACRTFEYLAQDIRRLFMSIDAVNPSYVRWYVCMFVVALDIGLMGLFLWM